MSNANAELRTLGDCVNLLIPILMATKAYDNEMFKDVIDGKGKETFKTVCINCDSAVYMLESIFDEDFRRHTREEILAKCNGFADRFYDNFFNHDYNQKRNNIVGTLILTEKSVGEVLEVLNFFSGYMIIE